LNPKPGTLNRSSSIQPTAGIVLAAGESIRFGKTKQLLEFDGKYLIEWVLIAALESRLTKTILVLGHAYRAILDALGELKQHPDLQVAVNRDYKMGQSSSLREGLKLIRDEFPAAMFLLGDQPLLDSKTINRLLDRFWSSDKNICIPVFEGKRGNPVIFRQNFYDHLVRLSGDIGARNIIRNHPEDVLATEIENPQCFFDVDTQSDFDELVEKLRRQRKMR
jgi:molybdenum cofactor cytidylyltransferase